MANNSNPNALIEEEEDIKEEPDAVPSGFMALYTSLMMLLMTFFIVLFSMATTSTSKFHRAKESVQDELSNLGLSASKRAMVFLYSLVKVRSSVSQPLSADPKQTSQLEEDFEGMDQEVHLMEKVDGYWVDGENLENTEKIGKLIQLGLNMERLKEDLVIRFLDSELFEPGEAKLKPKGKLLLSKTFHSIEDDFEEMIINAFNMEARESDIKLERKNASYLLSSLRSLEVARIAHQILNVPLESISFRGHGKFKPSIPLPKTDNEVKFNNRIEIMIRGLWNTKEDAETENDTQTEA